MQFLEDRNYIYDEFEYNTNKDQLWIMLQYKLIYHVCYTYLILCIFYIYIMYLPNTVAVAFKILSYNNKYTADVDVFVENLNV